MSKIRKYTGDMASDTSISPEAVADSVVEEVEAYLGQSIGGRELANSLADEARAIYKNSKDYQKKVRSNEFGRDWAYSFMRHWTASRLNRTLPELARKLPQSFANGDELPRELSFSRLDIVAHSSRRRPRPTYR